MATARPGLGDDAYSQLVRGQLSIPIDIWSRRQLYEDHFQGVRMAGSTSDEQSVFDAPTVSTQRSRVSNTRQSSESTSSPPNSTNNGAADCPPDSSAAGQDASSQAQNSKQKRIACIICRRRKLKCDGARPRCSTCARLKHECGYDETRKKSGPKRGYVKLLEQRLKQIENQLKTDADSSRDRSSLAASIGAAAFDPTGAGMAGGLLGGAANRSPSMDPNSGASGNMDGSADGFPWEMIGLGLEEPLPPQDIVNDLHQIYFDKLHPSMPMIHKFRYQAAMNLAPSMRPPIALRYAIWSYACSVSDKYQNFQEMFYQRARKYAEVDEMKGFGEQIFTVGHVQAWVIIANYEFKMLYFPRAWMSVGRAVRLAQMHSLYRVDGKGLEVKQCLSAPKDWVDREERRRTFWAAYCFDRWASIGTGWPMNIDERDIHTNLPVSDDAFEKCREETGVSLSSILKGGDPAKLSSYSSVILMASVIGKTLTHLHRTDGRDDAQDIEGGDFWRRHSYLDHILTNTTVCLPEHLRLVPGMADPNVIFLHMNIHSTAICLHQAAILKAEQNNLGDNVIKESTERCYVAATEIANIWRTISHLDISFLSPYVAFCLFVAARVFVHAYRKSPDDEETRRSLHFLLNAMENHRKRNDITESFLMQLLVDLEELGFENTVIKRHASLLSRREGYGVYQTGNVCAPVMPRHSDQQPSYRDIQAQAEAQRMAALYNQSNNNNTNNNSNPVMGINTAQLNMPIRGSGASHQMGMANQRPLPGSGVHNVSSLGQDFDLNMPYQQGFSMPSQSPPSNQQSPSAQGTQAAGLHHEGQPADAQNQFFQGDFDMSMLNGAFDMGQDTSMMQDLQQPQWTGMNANYPDGTQSTPASAWATFI